MSNAQFRNDEWKVMCEPRYEDARKVKGRDPFIFNDFIFNVLIHVSALIKLTF